jgi:hypothetical protein
MDNLSSDEFIYKIQSLLEEVEVWTDEFDSYLSSDDQYYDNLMDWVYPLRGELREVILNIELNR